VSGARPGNLQCLDTETIAAAMVGTGSASSGVRIEQNCLLRETGGKRALFDIGLGAEKLCGPDSGKLLAAPREAGIDPGVD
jgi:hypothetical protein